MYKDIDIETFIQIMKKKYNCNSYFKNKNNNSGTETTNCVLQNKN